MKKYFTLGLFLILFAFSSYPQDIQLSKNYTISEGEEYERTSQFNKRHYSWNKGSYILYQKRNGFAIQQIDIENLKEVSRTEINNVFNYKKEDVEQILQFDDTIFIFISSKVKKVEILEVLSISLKDFKASNRRRVLSSSKKLTKAKDRNEYSVRSKFNFKRTKTNKLMIEYVERDSKLDQTNLVVTIFDNTITSIKTFSINIENSKTISVVDRYMDNNDNCYFLGKRFKYSTLLKNKIPEDHKLVLYQTANNNSDISRAQITLKKERKIDVAKLHLTNDNNLKVIGTLRNNAAKDGLIGGKIKGEPTGIFILSLDDNLQTTDLAYHQFPIEMLEKNLGKKETKKIKKKDKSEQFDSYFKHLKILTNNNDANNETIIIGEQQYITFEQVRKIQYTRSHFNNILAAKILPDGSIKWMHKLIKFQRGRYGKSDMSINNLRYNDKHYIFFRDNEKNFGVEQGEIRYAYAYGRGGVLAAYVVDDQSGEVSKEVIYYPEGRTTFKFISKISDHEVLYEQHLEKKNRLVKISIKP